ncbi:MAG: hypothetical protein KGY46_02500 [Anaerolineales bacterium]|nr:hypothetical protein [Anaerolineales bacterium]
MKHFFKKHYLLIILILLNISFAVVFGGDFGDSWDEKPRYEAALQAISQYKELEPNKNIGDKGPIYWVFAKLGGDLIQSVNPNLTHIQAWHYIHFLTFILSVIALYSICLRFLSPEYSFLTAALFNTQPLLFGHAFINPKDIPFMAFFLLTISSGLTMIDKGRIKAQHHKSGTRSESFWDLITSNWAALNTPRRLLVLLTGILPPIALSLFRLYSKRIQVSITAFINSIQNEHFLRILNQLSFYFFRGNIDSGVTLNNVKTIYPYLFVLSGLIFGGLVALIGALFLPNVIRFLLGFKSWKNFLEKLKIVVRNPNVYLAALILGVSIVNRSLSLAAGFFVIFYLWVNYRSYFLPVSFMYTSVAMVTVYLSWPSMWGNPILGFLKSFFTVSDFSWGGGTLFWGTLLKSSNLPKIYIPTLISLQFTLPTIILFLIGLIAVIFLYSYNKGQKTIIVILAAWFTLPLLSTFIVKPATYDNFRHYLFLTPPIFVFAGFGIKYLLSLVPNYPISILLIILILLPGIHSLITLHPYQYIYYNELVGGVSGAFRKFEMDYWGTSYRECTLFINQEASENDSILVFGPAHIVKNYAREDLKVLHYREPDLHWMVEEADYAIISTRRNKDLSLLDDKPTIYSVTRAGATLAVVKDINP